MAAAPRAVMRVAPILLRAGRADVNNGYPGALFKRRQLWLHCACRCSRLAAQVSQICGQTLVVAARAQSVLAIVAPPQTRLSLVKEKATRYTRQHNGFSSGDKLHHRSCTGCHGIAGGRNEHHDAKRSIPATTRVNGGPRVWLPVEYV